jgi:predicted outer membrane protein
MQSEIQSGSDSDLKAFAQKTLPTVQEHLRMAKQVQEKS